MECFCRSLGSGNERLFDQLILGCLVRQPYVVVAQLLDHMIEANEETERDFDVAYLLTQLTELTKKAVELGVKEKNKNRYNPPHEWTKD